MHILLVEDNDTEAELIRESLAENHTFQRVDCLAFALDQLIYSRPFDCVIIDLDLPDSKGADTFTRLSDVHSGVSIVVYSGEPSDVVAHKIIACGAAFVRKSIHSLSELGEAVSRATGRQQRKTKLLQRIKSMEMSARAMT